MKTKIIVSFAIAILLPGLALAGPGKGKGLKKIDSNQDGALSLSEVESSGATRLAEDFSIIDSDSSGTLTRDELGAHRKNKMQERRERARKADTDGTGGISKDEAQIAGMQKMVEHFEKLDANNNGEVTRDEMRAFHKTMKEKRGKGPGKKSKN